MFVILVIRLSDVKTLIAMFTWFFVQTGNQQSSPRHEVLDGVSFGHDHSSHLPHAVVSVFFSPRRTTMCRSRCETGSLAQTKALPRLAHCEMNCANPRLHVFLCFFGACFLMCCLAVFLVVLSCVALCCVTCVFCCCVVHDHCPHCPHCPQSNNVFLLLRRWLIVAAYIISADGLTLNNIKSSGALNYNSPFGKTTTGKIHNNLIHHNKLIFDMNFFFDVKIWLLLTNCFYVLALLFFFQRCWFDWFDWFDPPPLIGFAAEALTPVCQVQEGCVYNTTTNITFGVSLQYYNSTHDDYCCGTAMAPAPAPAPFVNNTNRYALDAFTSTTVALSGIVFQYQSYEKVMLRSLRGVVLRCFMLFYIVLCCFLVDIITTITTHGFLFWSLAVPAGHSGWMETPVSCDTSWFIISSVCCEFILFSDFKICHHYFRLVQITYKDWLKSIFTFPRHVLKVDQSIHSRCRHHGDQWFLQVIALLMPVPSIDCLQSTPLPRSTRWCCSLYTRTNQHARKNSQATTLKSKIP